MPGRTRRYQQPEKREVMEIYLKKQAVPGVIFSVAKVTENTSIEIGGGAIETYNDTPSEVAMLGYQDRGFIECSKSEYDEKVKQVVQEINALV